MPGSACQKKYPAAARYTGVETFPGIPNKYLFILCLALSFLFFWAGGTAFDQSPFYAVFFYVLGLSLFFAGVHLGRRDPGSG
jgi:hypothetical protein